MAEADPLRKYVEAGIAFTQLTKARTEAIVRELVKAGEVQREQAQDRVEELLDRSRKSTEGLVGVMGLVRKEIAQQLSSMGLATKKDLAQMERRVEDRLNAMASSSPSPGPAASPAAERAASPAAARKAAVAKKAVAKKAVAKTAVAKTAMARKAAPETQTRPRSADTR